LKIDFSKKLNSTERRAWKASENACRNFLGKEKEENCSAIVQEPISLHSGMGCKHVLKTPLSAFPFRFFPRKHGLHLLGIW
jgi:hypothetical protein